MAAVERLADAGIPVVTLVTDLPTSRRVAYVGLDNRAAGATAAYLLDRWLPDDAAVLVTRGTGTFRGEDDREMGFRATMRALRPGRRQVDLIDPSGDGEVLRGLVRDALAAAPDIAAVYSMYATGGNARDRGRLRRRRAGLPGVRRPRPGRREPRAAAGRAGVGGAAPRPGARICAAPARWSCRRTARCPGTPRSWHSGVQVVTPYNIPAEALAAP